MIGLMRPLIGVTTSELRSSHLKTLDATVEMALGMTYMQALALGGAQPVVLPPVAIEDADDLVRRLDGVVLSGGPDVDPASYGVEERHPLLGPTHPELDAYELAVARAADRAGLPILAICRGAQALNVARGGTLVQHLEGHRQTEGPTVAVHDVRVAARCRLARLTRVRELPVNSFHHQAVDRLGSGLRVTARSHDGVVEAFEGRDGRFLVGVQWHAETLVHTREHLALFQALTQAARGDRRRLRAVA